MIRRGKWYEMQNLPFIPGSDFVGTIHEIGSEAAKISTFQVGDRVAALVPSGGNAKYITVEYRSIIRVPPEVDSESALCLSSTYVPAREALDLGRKMNTPFTGANILVIGGNGPSGLATIELALLEGANVYATADERHHEYLAKLGAKCFPIDPAKWLPTLTGKMDVVLDSVCLDGYKSSSLALNSAGILVCTGMSAVYTQGAMPTLMLKDDRDVRAMYFKTRVKFLWDNAVYYDRVERFASAPNEYAVSDSSRNVYLYLIACTFHSYPLLFSLFPKATLSVSLSSCIQGHNHSAGVHSRTVE
jgi:NADPH:quinone reductase-like Zn-dependent oxidoreductase